MKRLASLLIIATLVGSLYLLLDGGPPDNWPSGDQIEIIQAQGDEIVAQIERQREESGRYPELGEVQLLEAAFGGWVYMRSLDGSFQLQLGDYGKGGFTLWWNQKQGEWYVDT